MGETTICIDLRERGAASAHSYAFYRLRELRPGQVAELLSAEEPRLLMEGVSLGLRHRIRWTVSEGGPPLWRVSVVPREDVEADTLTDLLQRDHERVDRAFAEALAKINAGDVAGAGAQLSVFARGLRRHIHAENEVLAPAFVAPRSALEDDPLSIMLREHEEILQQVALLEACFAQGLPAAAEVAPFFAMLSGQLAKHEGREEQNLFPRWARALAHAAEAHPAAERQLVARVKAVLEGAEDVRIGGGAQAAPAAGALDAAAARA